MLGNDIGQCLYSNSVKGINRWVCRNGMHPVTYYDWNWQNELFFESLKGEVIVNLLKRRNDARQQSKG